MKFVERIFMFWQKHRKNKIVNEELIAFINKVKEKFTDDSDLLWTSYESAKEMRDELDGYINQLSHGDESCLEKLHVHFWPHQLFRNILCKMVGRKNT